MILKKLLIPLYQEFLLLKVRAKAKLIILNSEQTIRFIKTKHCCIARYGDGEFNLMLEKKNLGFQRLDLKLSKRLRDALIPNPNLLVCIPRYLNCLCGMKQSAKDYWLGIGLSDQADIANILRETCGKNYIFGDACITRPYMDMKKDDMAKRIFPMIKGLWEKENVLIVEGEQTRLGIGNDLFSNCSSIKRILAPAVDAFSKYDRILNKTMEHGKGKLVLIALGPTATVLASELSTKGIWALDIGHIDIEYEWFRLRASAKVPVEGKYVNEGKKTGKKVTDCNDETYLSQIICKIV